MQIGIRGSLYAADDLDWALAQGIRVIAIEEYFERGPADVIAEARRIVGSGPTYVSFDVDALDPVYAPGTGTPEVGGFSTYDAQQMIRGLRGLDLVGGDVVEVSPPFDTRRHDGPRRRHDDVRNPVRPGGSRRGTARATHLNAAATIDPGAIEIVRHGDQLTVRLGGRMTLGNAEPVSREARRGATRRRRAGGRSTSAPSKALDTAGAWILFRFLRRLEGAGVYVELARPIRTRKRPCCSA